MTEAKLSERFDAFRHDLSAFYSGLYVAELLHDLTDRHDPHPRLFDAAVVTLRRLRDPQVRPRRVLRFELALLRELGVMPALLACVHCGKPAGLGEGTLERERSVSFGLATGGVLCPNCRAGQPHVATLSAETLGFIQALTQPGDCWRDPAWTSKTVASARATIGAVVAHQLGRRPKMAPYLERGD